MQIIIFLILFVIIFFVASITTLVIAQKKRANRKKIDDFSNNEIDALIDHLDESIEALRKIKTEPASTMLSRYLLSWTAMIDQASSLVAISQHYRDLLNENPKHNAHNTEFIYEYGAKAVGLLDDTIDLLHKLDGLNLREAKFSKSSADNQEVQDKYLEDMQKRSELLGTYVTVMSDINESIVDGELDGRAFHASSYAVNTVDLDEVKDDLETKE